MSETMPREPGLTVKQQRFVEFYASNGGNAVDAARQAGYKTPDPEGARLLGNDRIRDAIRELTKDADESRIATAKDRQEFFTRMMKDEAVPYRDRIRAAELLGKAQGDFIERREIIKRTVDQMDSEELLQYKISLEEKRAVVLQMKTRALPKIESSKSSNIIDVESIEAAK